MIYIDCTICFNYPVPNLDKRLKLLERLKLRLNGYLYVGDQMKEGWKTPQSFYMFECPVHGVVKNYPKGYSQRLECPICVEEEKQTLKQLTKNLEPM